LAGQFFTEFLNIHFPENTFSRSQILYTEKQMYSEVLVNAS